MTEKGQKLCNYASKKMHILFRKERIMHIWLTKYKIFLRHGGAAPHTTPKSCMRIYFDRIGTEIVHLWFPRIHILLRKEMLPPFDHWKSYIYVNVDQTGLEIMHI